MPSKWARAGVGGGGVNQGGSEGRCGKDGLVHCPTHRKKEHFFEIAAPRIDLMPN